MPHYKSPDNRVHWLESAEHENLLPTGSIQIADEEAEELRSPPETQEQMETRIKGEIDAIERREIMPRKTREIQIKLMEYLAFQEAGLTPQQLYQVNPAYKGMVDVEAQITALRALL